MENHFLKINRLIPTQNTIRSHEKCAELVKFIREGRIFRHNPVRLTKFIGGDTLYIHDGHHRLSAMHYSGLRYLYPDEYVIFDYRLEDYRNSNIEKGWVTPFNPITHVRISDLSKYKSRYTDEDIWENNPDFSEKRVVNYINGCYRVDKLERYL